jgi:hypothetical protein
MAIGAADGWRSTYTLATSKGNLKAQKCPKKIVSVGGARAGETLRTLCERNCRPDRERGAATRRSVAIGEASGRQPEDQPVHRVRIVLPAGGARADSCPTALRLLRERDGRRGSERTAYLRTEEALERSGDQRSGLSGARVGEGPDRGAAGLRVSGSRPVPVGSGAIPLSKRCNS